MATSSFTIGGVAIGVCAIASMVSSAKVIRNQNVHYPDRWSRSAPHLEVLA
jgi:hypothetical protein